MRRGPQSLRECKGEQDHRQYQRGQGNHDQVDPLITQVHEDGCNQEDLCQRCANQKEGLQPLRNRSVAEAQSKHGHYQQPEPGHCVCSVGNCMDIVC